MAASFSRRQQNFIGVLRVPFSDRKRVPEVFDDLVLDHVPDIEPLPSDPRIDWSEIYLVSFIRFLRRQPSGTTLYTRSGRFAWLSCRFGFRTVLELHDPLTPTLISWLQRVGANRRLTGIVATTPRLRDDLVELAGFPRDRILVAGGGANAKFVELPPGGLTSEFAFNAGYAGSAYKGKGVDVILACAERMPAVGFHIIGPDPREISRLSRVPGNVVLHGRKSNRETIRLLKNFDCLLLPNQATVVIANNSDIGSHTSPLKMFEYMTTGRPFIASDLPVFKHVLKDNRNALLCPPHDPDAFCEKIRLLQNQPEIGHRIAENSRAEFLREYSWDRRAEKILEFINHQGSD